MGYYDLDSDQLGEEVLFNLKPTVSDAAGQPQIPVLLQQPADIPIQNNTNTVLAIAGVCVVLYLFSRS